MFGARASECHRHTHTPAFLRTQRVHERLWERICWVYCRYTRTRDRDSMRERVCEPCAHCQARACESERVSERATEQSDKSVYFCVCRRDFPYPEPGSWAQGCSQQTRPATHWATLQHTATHYNTLERALAAAPPGRALQQTATHQVRGQPHVPTQTT